MVFNAILLDYRHPCWLSPSCPRRWCRKVRSALVCCICFEHGTLRTFFPKATGEAACIRGNCVSFTSSPPVCSVVLIKCLEIKSVAQVPSAQKSFLKQIPELSTHPPCNWLPSAFYWIVFKQIKPKLEQGGDNSWSHCTQTGGLLLSHCRDRCVFSLCILAIKKNQPWSKSHRFLTYTFWKDWEKHESCHLGPSSVKGKKTHSIDQGFSRADMLPKKMLLETQSLLEIVSDWSLDCYFGPSVNSIYFGWIGYHIPKSPWHIAFLCC